MRHETSLRKLAAKSLPETPGVYVFWSKNLPIYIGKAKNLKRRVESYFVTDLAPKTDRMVSESDFLSYIKVDSELESLLLEASLIKKNQPKYNSVSKDDKHPLYIKITKETYPRVITARRTDEKDSLAFYGPFPYSSNVYSVLRMLRRIFPYSDHKVGKRPCLYSHLGLCNPCPNEILKIEQKRKYLKNIQMIKKVLSRKIDTVKKALEKNMNTLSKQERFEEATIVREQISRLDYITQPIIPKEYFLENPNLFEDIRRQELRELGKLLTLYFPHLTSIRRIECYDVAHLAGSFPTASMVTFISGESDKNFYRHFRIMQKEGQNDIESLREVIKRRLKYLDKWGRPDLIIVDGSKSQVKAFTEVLYSNEVAIPVVGIAKNPDRLIIKDKKIRLRGDMLHLVSRIRDEAHRFARRYHHKLVSRQLLTPES